MLQLKQPGVYTQIVPSGAHSITGSATSVALFVGPTVTGIDDLPVRVQSFGEFERLYGGLSQTSNLSYAVLHFFANGGTEAFIKRVKANGAAKSRTALRRDGGTNTSITLEALSSGAASNEIFVEIDSFDIGGDPFTTDATKQKAFSLSVLHAKTGASERFAGLSVSSSSARFAPKVVGAPGSGSKLVNLDLSGTAVNAERPVTSGTVYEIKDLPLSTATFAKEVKVTVTVGVRDTAGDIQGSLSVTVPNVLVFAKDSATPTNSREIANKLQSAINLAIRGDSSLAAKMKGVEITVATGEGGKYLWLRTSAPGAETKGERLYDATVTLADPTASGTVDSFVGMCLKSATPKVANPSRYRLGATYTPANNEQVVASAVRAGADGDANGQPATDDFKQAILDLEKPDPFFNLLCLPDLVRPAPSDPKALQHSSALAIYGEAARICSLKYAFLLIDPPPAVVDTGSAEAFKMNDLAMVPASGRTSAVYFPNIRVDDPLAPGSITDRPPSGAMAGLFARTDAQYGVWQAPAGTEAVISGCYGPSVELSDAEHGTLNVVGVNVIRKFPIFGVVSYGSRTVDGANAATSEWKYVPVIRTANHILRSLSEGLRWAVHKPNGEVLWSQIRLSATAFMLSLYRQGAFKGVSSREAFFVQCDASTTSPDDINQGVVNIQVGFAPLKPAEFVVISLRQIVQPAA